MRILSFLLLFLVVACNNTEIERLPEDVKFIAMLEELYWNEYYGIYTKEELCNPDTVKEILDKKFKPTDESIIQLIEVRKAQ